MIATNTATIKVSLAFDPASPILVGRLAVRDHVIYFEYDASFLKHGLEISPLRLPLKTGVQKFDNRLFEGLPGVFNDSLPDGWGRLLLDRALRAQGIHPDQVSPLDRLAHVGMHGMGALIYEPDTSEAEKTGKIDLDDLSRQTQEVLAGAAPEVLQELIALNGSSAGARPKVMLGVNASRTSLIYGTRPLPENYDAWLVKFANANDGPDAGAIEYVYALMAKEAGVEMTETHLFPAKHGAGYFATQRFDREGSKKIHTHTACGLLHTDFRAPALDYKDLIALTWKLTRDIREVRKMFRLAVFNVLGHNRDDHAKNFSFLMNEAGEWRLSPAYDLTFSAGPWGEQSTMVMGEGKNPTRAHLIQLGKEAGLDESFVLEVIDATQTALARWTTLAKEYGVLEDNIQLVGDKISDNGS